MRAQHTHSLQGCVLGQAYHPAEVAPVGRAVAPWAAHSGGVGGRARLPGTAPCGTTSPWAAASQAIKIRQLRCQLPFYRGARPTEETRKTCQHRRRGVGRVEATTGPGLLLLSWGSTVAPTRGPENLRTLALKTNSS